MNNEQLAEEIICAIISEHISCKHEETLDGSGKKFDDVEYDVDAEGKKKIEQILSH